MMEDKVTSLLVVGVGGQGVVLASDIIAEVFMEYGLDAKKADVHGMAQRAGSVYSYVRWGKKVYGPVFGEGEADLLLAFEQCEALRFQKMLKLAGTAIINEQKILPVAAAMGLQPYPSDEVVAREFAQARQRIIGIDARKLATELGEPRAANSVLLGVLARLLKPDIEVWEAVIARRVPAKAKEVNLAAFRAGLG